MNRDHWLIPARVIHRSNRLHCYLLIRHWLEKPDKKNERSKDQEIKAPFEWRDTTMTGQMPSRARWSAR